MRFNDRIEITVTPDDILLDVDNNAIALSRSGAPTDAHATFDRILDYIETLAEHDGIIDDDTFDRINAYIVASL